MKFTGFFENKSPFDFAVGQIIFCWQDGKVIAQTRDSGEVESEQLKQLLGIEDIEEIKKECIIGDPIHPWDWELKDKSLSEKEKRILQVQIVIEFWRQHLEWYTHSVGE